MSGVLVVRGLKKDSINAKCKITSFCLPLSDVLFNQCNLFAGKT